MERFLAARPCAKCGSKEASAEYCGVGSRFWRYRCDRWGPHPEHIRRRCPRCGYEWDEAPLDAATEASG